MADYSTSIFRNKSGYYDETAFKAMKNVMSENRNDKTGEIWEVETGISDPRYCIILKDHKSYCTVLHLIDESINDNCIEITAACIGTKYTEPGRISYLNRNKFYAFVLKLKDAEYNKIMNLVIESFEFEKETIKEKPAMVSETKEKALPSNYSSEYIEKLQEANKSLKKTVFEQKISITKAETEANIYKELYLNEMNK